MRVDLVTKEYPPEIYGGAGVHVAELVKALRRDIEVVVHAFGAPRSEAGTRSYPVPGELASANPALQTLGVDVAIAADVAGADIVHSHTWYANFAGRTAQLLHGIPHVVTAHSLSRCARGRRSSSAGATGCPPGSNAMPVSPRTPSSP